jgi:[ribosomal protein S5]-alanine N-acetyltransferase
MSKSLTDLTTEFVCKAERTVLTLADRIHAQELQALQERNQTFHQPWVYKGDIEQYFGKIADGKTIGLFLWRTDQQSLIGVINLNDPVRGGFQSACLGYYGDHSVARLGYMTEGLGLVLDYAFSELGFHRLEANIQPGNVASIALVKRLGFRLEGFSPKYLKIGEDWRDHQRWAILADDWTQRVQT